MIQLRQVEFTYPASSSSFRLAVDALTLDAGEKLAIVGPSGSGKTTLLNLLAGILVPNLGSVLVAGVDVSGLSEKERRDFRISNIGMVFQQFELLEYLTVADNIRLPFLINGSLSARESVPPADLLAAVGLAGFEKRYPRELSRGEQQRVAICRAMLTGPQLILADEPTGNLDPANKSKVLNVLFEQSTARNQTLVVVTHDHSVLSDFDRVIDFETFLQPVETTSEATA